MLWLATYSPDHPALIEFLQERNVMATTADQTTIEDHKDMDCATCGSPAWMHTREELKACKAPMFRAREDVDEVGGA
jgi:hypothetical protein